MSTTVPLRSFNFKKTIRKRPTILTVGPTLNWKPSLKVQHLWFSEKKSLLDLCFSKLFLEQFFLFQHLWFSKKKSLLDLCFIFHNILTNSIQIVNILRVIVTCEKKIGKCEMIQDRIGDTLSQGRISLTFQSDMYSLMWNCSNTRSKGEDKLYGGSLRLISTL